MWVDDETEALHLFETFLTDAGYEVATAQSGFECLAALSSQGPAFDLIVLDYNMPFMDGEETLRRIRALSTELPVILSTGFIHQHRLDAMLASGLSGFMRKPLPPEEVVAHVAAVLEAAKGQAVPVEPRGIAAAL